jgi:hypothetical protein
VGGRGNAYRPLVGKPDGRRPFGRCRRGWEDDVKIDHKEVGLESLEWINLAQDRDLCRAVVNTVMNLGIP